MQGNPWGLNDTEAKIMDLLVETGCNKATARRLFRSAKTVESHMGRIIAKMNMPMQVVRCVAWDRWRRNLKETE